ncbi:PREDICTED: protein shisa-3 homolog [Propithecus coquereli]|uniref:protein shisa-3 homolog n=1 Tax=Propithecus coquereli TaxID=379532 RepID=UPI00063F66BE|nr:PREDICTED: protein shisa-3 homolog [Propithecus coquereli]
MIEDVRPTKTALRMAAGLLPESLLLRHPCTRPQKPEREYKGKSVAYKLKSYCIPVFGKLDCDSLADGYNCGCYFKPIQRCRAAAPSSDFLSFLCIESPSRPTPDCHAFQRCPVSLRGGDLETGVPAPLLTAENREPVYVPFLIVGSIFIAFVILGSVVAIYCCTCLRPKEPSQQPIRFSLRSYQTETLPMILTPTGPRAPSRQSSTATSSSSTGGSVRRFSFARAEPCCLAPSPPPPYSTAHPIHLAQPSGFLVSPQYFAYPLQQEPPLPGKSCPDFSSS